jgi:hypothetical protein
MALPRENLATKYITELQKSLLNLRTWATAVLPILRNYKNS